jgi:peptide/nickel transport system ATP-binding protein
MSDEVIRTENLTKHFPIKMGFFKTLVSKEVSVVRAVDDVSFSVKKQEVFGLVGESGSGKTTLGRMLLRLIEPTSGKIFFDGEDIALLSEKKMRKLRSRMQLVFQDPYDSINPRMSVFDIIAEPLELQKAVDNRDEMKKRIIETLEEMGLTPAEAFLYRFPHELSGGQRQRVAVARVFALRPEFVVADEPVSMLDASIRGEILKLMLGFVEKFGSTFVYITHDLALSRAICTKIGVMYFGKIVEMGQVEDVVYNSANPYTSLLLSAVLVPNPNVRRIQAILKGEIPSPLNPPSGCRFHPRCPNARDICKQKEPALVEIEKDHFTACHYADQELKRH